MKKYTMSVRQLKNKFEYTIKDENGNVIDTRGSERSYVPATVAHKDRDGKDYYRTNYHGKTSDAGNTGDAKRYREMGYDVGVAYLTL